MAENRDPNAEGQRRDDGVERAAGHAGRSAGRASQKATSRLGRAAAGKAARAALAKASPGAFGAGGGAASGAGVAGGTAASGGTLLLIVAAVVAALIALLIVVMMVVVIAAGRAAQQSACSKSSSTQMVSTWVADGIPPQLTAVFQGAAATYGLGDQGAFILAGIAQVETNFGTADLPGVRAGLNSYGCCSGPMQFFIVPSGGRFPRRDDAQVERWGKLRVGERPNSTWGSQGVDGDGDGIRDVWNIVDAIYSSANYLKNSGAPGDWRRAIFAYNRADWYVNKVLAAAERFQTSAVSTTGNVEVAAPPAGGENANGDTETGRWTPWVYGDTDFDQEVGDRLYRMARATNTKIYVQDGGRSMEEQQQRYDTYLNGGPVAAAPTPSAPHIRRVAADITPGRATFGAVARQHGLDFTVPSESWHIELYPDPGKSSAGAAINVEGGDAGQLGCAGEGALADGGTVEADVQLIPGEQAQINADGTAAAPKDAPPEVKQLIAAGNRLVGKPYQYGGGHGDLRQTITTASGFDCSATVTFALYGAGIHPPTSTNSVGLMSWGSPGRGKWITVYTAADHAYLEVAGIRLDTSSNGDPSGNKGPRWRPANRDNARFMTRHWERL